MSKIKLNISERIQLGGGLPARGGTKETQRAFNTIKAKIELNEAELNMYEVRVLQNGQMTWNDDKEQRPKEFDLTEVEVNQLDFFFNNLEEQSQFPSWGVDVDDQIKEALKKK